MDANNLQILLRQIGIKTQMGNNGWLRGLCPYHDESRPSWGIFTEADHHPFSCFSCKAHGSLYRLLIDIGHYSEEKSGKLSKIPGQIRSVDIQLEKKEIGMWPIDQSELYPFDLTRNAANYLKKRGIDPGLAKNLGIVYEPKLHRILFPWKFRAKLFGVTGRTLDPLETNKTMPLYGTMKGQLLYLPSGRISGRTPLILCEGEIDAVKIYQSGAKNVAAFGFGKMTDEQANLIQLSADSVICFFDDDHAGGLLEMEVHNKLSGKVKISKVNWELMREVIDYGDRENLDPGNMTSAEITTALMLAVKNSDWPEL